MRSALLKFFTQVNNPLLQPLSAGEKIFETMSEFSFVDTESGRTHQFDTGVLKLPVSDLSDKVRAKLGNLWYLVSRHCFDLWGGPFFIAGGSVREAFDDTDSQDIDVFSTSDHPDWQAVAAHGAELKARTENGVYIKFPKDWGHNCINGVTCSHGSPDKVIAAFDLSCSQVAYDGEYLYYTPEFIQDVDNMVVRLQRCGIPSGRIPKTWARMLKHVKYGYTLEEETINKMAGCLTVYSGVSDPLQPE